MFRIRKVRPGAAQRLASAALMSADRDAARTLTAKSLLRRRRLSLLAFLLGLGSVTLSLTVVVSSLLQTRQAAEERYLNSTSIEVRMLDATIALGQSDPGEKVRNAILIHWTMSQHSAADERLVIINNADSGVILDTAWPDPVHAPWLAKDVPEEKRETTEKEISRQTKESIVAVRERMQLRDFWNGEFVSGNGVAQLGSFKNVSTPNWLLGIYRSKEGLHASAVQASYFNTLIIACGLAMPLSMLLMYYTYNLAQRGQVRAEEARARLGAIVESSDDAIYSQSFEGIITSWNRGAEQMFGYSAMEVVGKSSAEMIPNEMPTEEGQIVAQIGRGRDPGEHSLETIRTCKDGEPIHVSQAISPIKDARGKYVGISIIARDITARKNLEREVLESTSREQQRIGHELHDSLGQELTGLSYLAKSLSQRLAAAKNPLSDTAQTITSGIGVALRAVRSAVQGLVPVEVDAAGFMVALEKLAADTRSRCGIECRIESEHPVPIDDNVLATHLFRIVQEAINNAVKHAHAKQIVVRPESRNGTLAVTVQDDGVGIGNQAERNGGMGLRIMQYRAGVIDATLEVRPTDGQGTAVICLVKNKKSETD